MCTSLLSLLVSYGLCFGLMNDKASALTDPLRKSKFFDQMLDCPYCTGFHTGWIATLLVQPQVLQGTWGMVTLSLFTNGLASAAFCYATDTLLKRLER